MEHISLRTVRRPPVSHRSQGGGCPTLDIDKDPKVQAFLDALALCGQVTQAARAAGISPKTAYRWRQAYPALASRWEAALEQGLDCLEEEAIRRAFEGSDKLLMFVLNRRRPRGLQRVPGQVSGRLHDEACDQFQRRPVATEGRFAGNRDSRRGD
jgi:hypothetical protein